MTLTSVASAVRLHPAPTVRRRPASLSHAEWAVALSMLSNEERRRLERLDLRGVQSFVGGRLLLRELAAELLGMQPAEVPLAAHCLDCGLAHGRPTIEGSDLRLSLAHSRPDVVAAASWGAAVGIDIEPIAGSEERLDAIDALTGHRTLRHWTRVEAVLKADGRGLRIDPRLVRVAQRGLAAEARVEGSRIRYRLLDLDAGPDAVGTIAVEF